jgi:phage terminase small subunit
MKKTAPRRSMFPKEFLVDLNATKAAKRCGYSKKTARQAGARLLSNVNIKKAIRKLMEKRSDRLEISRDEWLSELWLIGRSDLANHIEINDDTGAIRAKRLDEMPPNTSRALESITEIRTIHEDSKGEQSIINERVTFKLHSKIEALKTIGKHLGFLTDKVEYSGELSLGISAKQIWKQIEKAKKEMEAI